MDFVSQILELERVGNRDKAVDLIFGILDDLLLSGKFEECDSYLRDAIPRIKELPNPLIRSFCTIVWLAREELPHYQSYYEEAWKVIVERNGEERAKAVLGSLK